MADQDPFGGTGVKLASGGWVPANHPLALAQQQQQNQGGGAAPTSTPTGTPAATTIPQQAQNASTYSNTPGAAPAASTTNQGTQDVVRNSYLAQATQGTKVDTNDPAFRQQSDAYAAGVTRQARNYVADQAESGGPYATGALRGQARMANERAGQAIGSFDADLVGRELTNKRNEIQQALSALGGMVDTDQKNALTKQLADLDAQIKSLGINTDAGSQAAERALKEYLGTAGLNLDLARLNSDNAHWGDEFGLSVGDREAFWNNQALQSLF